MTIIKKKSKGTAKLDGINFKAGMSFTQECACNRHWEEYLQLLLDLPYIWEGCKGSGVLEVGTGSGKFHFRESM